MFLAPLLPMLGGALSSAAGAVGAGSTLGGILGGAGTMLGAGTTFSMGAAPALIGAGGAAAAAPTAAIAGLSAAAPMGALFSGLTAGSHLLQGVAGLRQAQAQQGYLLAQARSELGAGAVAGQRQQAIERAQLGQLRATMGGSGVQLSGSPMEVYMDSVKNAALNVQDKIYQGKIAAWQSAAQAGLVRRAGTTSLMSGIFGAGMSPGVGGLGTGLSQILSRSFA